MGPREAAPGDGDAPSFAVVSRAPRRPVRGRPQVQGPEGAEVGEVAHDGALTAVRRHAREGSHPGMPVARLAGALPEVAHAEQGPTPAERRGKVIAGDRGAAGASSARTLARAHHVQVARRVDEFREPARVRRAPRHVEATGAVQVDGRPERSLQEVEVAWVGDGRAQPSGVDAHAAAAMLDHQEVACQDALVVQQPQGGLDGQWAGAEAHGQPFATCE